LSLIPLHTPKMGTNANALALRNKPDVALLAAEFVVNMVATELSSRKIHPRFLKPHYEGAGQPNSDRKATIFAAASGVIEVIAGVIFIGLAKHHPPNPLSPGQQWLSPRSQPADLSNKGLEMAGGISLDSIALVQIFSALCVLAHPHMSRRIKTIVKAEKLLAADWLSQAGVVNPSDLRSISTRDLQRIGTYATNWLERASKALARRQQCNLTLDQSHRIAMNTANRTIAATLGPSFGP
jgi:hypothetical protein